MAEIVLNSSNFFHNIDLLSSKVGGTERLAIVLKDNGYGHGLLQIASLAKKANITRAVVRDIDEALKIKDIFSEIYVLCELPKDEMPHNFSFAINSLESLNRIKNGTKVDLKVDTGMHRNGILPSELDVALKRIKQNNLLLNSVFTHHRSADELSSEFFWQEKNFCSIKISVSEFCKTNALKAPRFHTLNSAGALRQNSFEHSFCRVGIAAYGYSELPSCFGDFGLKPVMSLYADKISTRELNSGCKIGYGGGYELAAKSILSAYDIGYGDGLFRLNEKHAYKNPQGQKLLGRVSMDYVSFEGDVERICVFDDVRTIVSLAGTITYDQLVKLSPKISRKIL